MAEPAASWPPALPLRDDAPASGSASSSFRILLVDPSALSRSCFIAALAGVPTIEISGVASVEDLDLTAIETFRPDAIALRVAGEHLGEDGLVKRLEKLGSIFPPARTMLLARNEAPDQLLCAMRMGVAGFITTDLSLAMTVTSLQMLREGLSVYTYSTLQSLRRIANSLAPKGRRSRNDLFPTPTSPSGKKFTARQEEVLQLLVDGLSNKVIAFRLNISESTVKVHIRAIMERSGVKTRAQIISWFLREKR
jgi:DNA-binding NarL/FixJ family response regulator